MHFFIVLSLAFLLSNCNQTPQTTTLPFYNGPDFTPEWIDTEDQTYAAIHTIAPFSFTNQDGDEISDRTFADKIYVADFIFTTCPGICPQLTRHMTRVQEAFADDPDVLLLSHSVTPATDTVPVLKSYAQRNGVRSGKWHLVTGAREAIYTLARTSYFADADLGFSKGANDFLHTENFVLVDAHKRIRGVYNGTLPLDIERLIEDIRLLKSES